MFRVLQMPQDRHFIDGGRVFCPLRGQDVEFDLCAGCNSMSEIDLEAKPAFVRCSPEVPRPWLLRRLV